MPVPPLAGHLSPVVTQEGMTGQIVDFSETYGLDSLHFSVYHKGERNASHPYEYEGDSEK